MESKLQELTDKLYSEGVSKAQEEAKVILEEAKKESNKILSDAKEKAEQLLVQAGSDAKEARKNVDSEIKMASQQAISTLQQQITKSISVDVVKPTLKEVFANKDYIQELIKKVVEGWSKTGNFDINVILPEDKKAEMDKLLKNSLATEMNKGLTFEFDKAVKAGFKVEPKDGSYVISFTENDFQNFFKSFLRPKTNQLLFQD
ncbi:MAG: hypothetical protein KAH10_02665 [Flavobacteriales bacterium]|nr:hypothetical protein [Flavobacteriales bacterium]